MATGLSLEQLMFTYNLLYEKQKDKARSEKQAEEHGESPTSEKLLEEAQKMMPNVEDIMLPLVTMLICAVNAILETIFINNEVIAKSIPPSSV